MSLFDEYQNINEGLRRGNTSPARSVAPITPAIFLLVL
jgi:hypothetical protein